METEIVFNPKLDLTFERKTLLTAAQIWRGWTDPETLMKWFCPKPWQVVECRIDLRAGGEFYTVMQSPEGQKFANHGCILVVEPNKRFVWTNAMGPGFRPQKNDADGFAFTGQILLFEKDHQTIYSATVFHSDEVGRNTHEKMGFQEGWGKAFDQLVELMNN